LVSNTHSAKSSNHSLTIEALGSSKTRYLISFHHSLSTILLYHTGTAGNGRSHE